MGCVRRAICEWYTFARTSNTFSFLIWFPHFSKYTFFLFVRWCTDCSSTVLYTHNVSINMTMIWCSERMSILSCFGQLVGSFFFCPMYLISGKMYGGKWYRVVMVVRYSGGNDVVLKWNFSCLNGIIGSTAILKLMHRRGRERGKIGIFIYWMKYLFPFDR